MNVLKNSTIAAAVLFNFGCSPGHNAEAPPLPAKTVFDPLTQQLKQARDVQKTVDQNMDNGRSRQERGESPP